ncbi:hypothetical protein M378DRAFT_166023 [Amanita muscaria Koide BX008]|uniref:Uncharacterized protein n=1 Tax=Amanita muscaria (strain Koide BX008) TaxID=946122 RepID=A0A0C2WZ86_AMAMK|nr:hypothetical protein M378DRAFT_166023 [Amanita muscaria Koide BX008]
MKFLPLSASLPRVRLLAFRITADSFFKHRNKVRSIADSYPANGYTVDEYADINLSSSTIPQWEWAGVCRIGHYITFTSRLNVDARITDGSFIGVIPSSISEKLEWLVNA